MAISNLGVVNNLPMSQLPTGYTPPVVATFADYEYKRVLTLNVLKATVENASPAITMANIIANVTVGLNKQITDIVVADFLTTPAVTTYGILTNLNTNIPIDQNNVYLGNTPVSYVCTVELYVKAI